MTNEQEFKKRSLTKLLKNEPHLETFALLERGYSSNLISEVRVELKIKPQEYSSLKKAVIDAMKKHTPNRH